MNMKTERERQEALHHFNQMADYYDDYRPDYPDELVKTIIDKAGLTTGSKALEIGAGSGKATAQFADFGFEMVCIEPGADLAEKGSGRFKGKNIRFIVSRFEDYAEPREYFDAILSAQAFHWVEQPIGFEKCANALKKGGYLAIFWHQDFFRREFNLDRELMAIVDKHNGWVSCMPEEDYPKRMESITLNIVGSGLFTKPEIIHFYWEHNFSADEYFRYMLTGNTSLEQACHEELTQLAQTYNGIKRKFHYELYLTQKL